MDSRLAMREAFCFIVIDVVLSEIKQF